MPISTHEKTLLLLAAMLLFPSFVSSSGPQSLRSQQHRRNLGITTTCDLFKVDVKTTDGTMGTHYYACIMEDDMSYPLDQYCPMTDAAYAALLAGSPYKGHVTVSITNSKLHQHDDPALDYMECNVNGQATVISAAGGGDRHRALVEDLQPTGQLRALAVYVTGRDSTPSYSADRLASGIFGGGTDTVNPASIYESCSNGTLSLVPAVGDGIVNGVTIVHLDIDVVGTDVNGLENLVSVAVDAAHLGTFDVVLYCMPDGVLRQGAENWGGYTYEGYGRSVYDNEVCLFPAFPVHEIGHNLNLGHSTEGEDVYGDGTCMMGAGPTDIDTEGPLKCFNAAKSWQLGWYSSADYHLLPDQLPWNGKIAALCDMAHVDSVNRGEYILLKFADDIYLSFNRKKGITAGTQEKPDQIVIVQEDESRDGHSILLTGLNDTHPTYNLAYGDKVVVFEFCEVVLDPPGGADYVKMSIHYETDGSLCEAAFVPLPAQTPAPTPAPVAPTPAPTSFVPCNNADEFRFTLLLFTDYAPWETYWVLRNMDNTTFYSVPEGHYTIPGHAYRFTECLSSSDTYSFEMIDASGDGIRNPGGYRLYRDDEEILCAGGDFLSVDRTWIQEACAPGYHSVEIDIVTDMYGSENSYIVEPASGDSSSSSSTVVGLGERRNLQPNMHDRMLGCFPVGGCYSFSIFDSGNDGFCCSFGKGRWSIRYQDEIHAYSRFLGGPTEEVTLFRIQYVNASSGLVVRSNTSSFHNHLRYGLHESLTNANTDLQGSR